MLILAAAVALAYWLSSRYIQYAQRSFVTASMVGNDLNKAVREVLDAEAPSIIARLSIQLMAIAGCGCFVRGILIGHYLPRVTINSTDDAAQAAFNELSQMSPELQAKFNKVVALVFIYDSYRNPLQGAMFRRIMRSFLRPEPRWSDQLEAKLAAFSVVSSNRKFAS